MAPSYHLSHGGSYHEGNFQKLYIHLHISMHSPETPEHIAENGTLCRQLLFEVDGV